MVDEQNDDITGPSLGGAASSTKQFLARLQQPVSCARLVAEMPVLSEEEAAPGQSAAHHPAQITSFCRMLKGRPLFDEKPSEWVRLAHIAFVVEGTSVADERTFSVMKFVTVHWPSLTTHLQLPVRAAEQTLFSMVTFTLGQARKE